jgi:hypothetical protein
VCKERDAHKKALEEAQAQIKKLASAETKMDALQKQAEGQAKVFDKSKVSSIRILRSFLLFDNSFIVSKMTTSPTLKY